MIARAKKLLAERRKLLAYAAGVATAATTAGVLHGTALQGALVVEALATGYGIHQASNA